MRMNGLGEQVFATAMTLRPKGAAIQSCETDFVVVSSRPRDHRIQIAIGECKTRKPITAADVANLKAAKADGNRHRWPIIIATPSRS